jgi:outer membrane lipoprotein carrier protein
VKEFKSKLVLYNKFISFFLIALFYFNYAITSAAFQPTKYTLLSDSEVKVDALNLLIDGLQQKYSRMNGIAAHFVQLYQGADGRTLRESGQVILKRPGKARWEYASPEKKLFISDGKNIFFYVYGEPQATKSSIKESADPQIPFLFLLGRGNLRKDFSRIELLSDERAIDAGNQVLRLVPRRAPEDFKKLLVEVNPSTFQVRRMVLFERNGARMEFMLSDIQENYVAPDNQFHFVPPAGVTIKSQG